MKKKLFSGIKPTGTLTLGNYIGAIKSWVELQQEYDCLFCLVDMHAMTVAQNPEYLREKCFDFIAQYIACGIDPEESIVFTQSHVPAHSELAWLLTCFTYMGELGRMTQFKDKSKSLKGKNINAGIFNYPALMAADILLYGTHLVPVGDDQKQHVELTRDIAFRFNSIYGDVFVIPDLYIPASGARIMNLLKPENKMDKSSDNPNTYIGLLDPPDVISKKLKSAVTDSSGDYYLKPKTGISNLITIMSTVTELTEKEIIRKYTGSGYSVFKKDLSDRVIEFLAPIQERYKEIRKDTNYLKQIIGKGSLRAGDIADRMIKKIHGVIGFIPRG